MRGIVPRCNIAGPFGARRFFRLAAGLLACIATTSLSAAAPGWVAHWGGRGADLGFGLATDARGNLYAGSQFVGKLDLKTLGGSGILTTAGHDVVLAAYDAGGGPLWQRQLGAADRAEVRDVASTADGTMVATGYFLGALGGEGRDKVRAVAGADAYVVAFAADGRPRYAQGFGGKGADVGTALAALPDGSVVLAGAFEQAARFGAVDGHARVLRAQGRHDAFLARLDRDGTVTWALAVGGAAEDRALALATAPDGGFAALIAFAGELTLDIAGQSTRIASNGDQDALVLRFTADGDLRSATPIGGVGPDNWYALAVATDGTTWVAGEIVGKAKVGVGAQHETFESSGSSDIALVALDTSGRLLRTRRFGNAAADTVHRLAALPGGGLLLAASGSGGIVLDRSKLEAPAPRAYVARLDENGRVLGAHLVAGEGITQPSGLGVLPDGRMAVLGMFEKALDTDTETIKSAGKSDVFLWVGQLP
jgi:hypothetical protein